VGEVRFSTRQAAKVTNYNEEDDYGLSEEDTQDATPNNWVVEQTGPSVDTVLNHRLNEGAGTRCHLLQWAIMLTCLLRRREPYQERLRVLRKLWPTTCISYIY